MNLDMSMLLQRACEKGDIGVPKLIHHYHDVIWQMIHGDFSKFIPTMEKLKDERSKLINFDPKHRNTQKWFFKMFDRVEFAANQLALFAMILKPAWDFENANIERQNNRTNSRIIIPCDQIRSGEGENIRTNKKNPSPTLKRKKRSDSK